MLSPPQGLGDDADDCASSSLTLTETEDGFVPVTFEPRPLRNLLLIDDVASMMPVTAMVAANLANEETPQLYTLCGRGSRSTLRVLRQASNTLQ